jgi:glucokinase
VTGTTSPDHAAATLPCGTVAIPAATGTAGTARLLADIGGTHARFAWQDRPGGPLHDERTLACAAHATLLDALHAYLRDTGRTAPPACAIAIATAVLGDQVAMTNHHWAFSIRELRARLGLQDLLVVNDFTALALSLPMLAGDERRPVGGAAPRPGAAIGLIGPGTGLGVSGLLADGRGGWLPIQGEGGHATLAATTARERDVLAVLAERHGHVSAERAVSGRGLEEIHAALGQLDGQPEATPPRTAAQVTAAALANQDPHSREALDLFCAFLGTAAGNLALTLGAQGGVYIGGGIVPRLGEAFDRSPFRARFEAKGRFRAYLAAIPVYVIAARASPALRGAAAALDLGLPFAGRVR